MPERSIPRRTVAVIGSMLMGATSVALTTGGGASSHRDAPLIAEDPVADNTDVYAYIAPDAPDHVTIISNYIPLQEPAGGPNFHNFGEDVLYEINVDNDGNADADLRYQFRFSTEIVDGNTPLYNEGPISFSGGEYQNLNIRQTYTVTEINDGVETVLASDVPVAPANIGPRSTPNYSALAANAVTDIDLGADGTMQVFAGPRDDIFPVDLGSIFDLGALRSLNTAHLIPLDTGDGVNATTGFNVHSIAIQIPKARVVEDDDVIGIHSTTSRRTTTVRSVGSSESTGDWVQISRLGQPLVNEVIVPLAFKDTFNGSALSAGDAAFLPVVQDPRLGQLLPVLYPGAFDGCYPEAPRDDLVTIFLTGIPGVNQPADVVPSEQLRLNTSVTPTAYADQSPLGLLAGQADGYPNGRRLGDDVVDISLQAVAGATPVGPCNGESPNNALGDGVVGNDLPFLNSFPYMPDPHQGYEHEHDHGEADDAEAPVSDRRTDQVRRLYLAYFLRESDAAGLDFWITDGRSMPEVSEEFARSQEFQDSYGDLDDAGFVELIYSNVLGRPSEEGGRNFWLQQLADGMSRGAIMLSFSNSPEFIEKVS